jgi:hypothetical protein
MVPVQMELGGKDACIVCRWVGAGQGGCWSGCKQKEWPPASAWAGRPLQQRGGLQAKVVHGTAWKQAQCTNSSYILGVSTILHCSFLSRQLATLCPCHDH